MKALLNREWQTLRRWDLIYLVQDMGGSVTISAINRIMGDSQRGLGLALARQSSRNASLGKQ
jgi:hypothetical protein